MAIDDNNLVKEGGSDTATGGVAQMPKKSYKAKKKELARKIVVRPDTGTRKFKTHYFSGGRGTKTSTRHMGGELGVEYHS